MYPSVSGQNSPKLQNIPRQNSSRQNSPNKTLSLVRTVLSGTVLFGTVLSVHRTQALYVLMDGAIYVAFDNLILSNIFALKPWPKLVFDQEKELGLISDLFYCLTLLQNLRINNLDPNNKVYFDAGIQCLDIFAPQTG